MKYLGFAMLLFMFIGCSCGGSESEKNGITEDRIDPNEEVVVMFVDERLEEIVREELEKPTGDITSIDMQELYFLTINEAGVKNLEGLEYALELREFSLLRETVDSLEPLKHLNQLERLTIRYSEIEQLPIEFSSDVNLNHISITGTIVEDVSFVENMTNLDHMTISDGGIKDISALKNLVNIEQLNFRGNEIEDISSLSEMHNLEILNLQGNQVSTISALSELESLNDVTISYNPVYNLEPLMTLPSLETVIVYLDHEVKHHIFEDVAALKSVGVDVSYHR